MPIANEIIQLLGLAPLPSEGGFYREMYRAEEALASSVLPARYGGARVFGSAIYYLLHDEHFSALHRLQTDEVYHFYLGHPVELLLLHPDGRDELLRLGTDLAAGQRPQAVVPRGDWQGARLATSQPGAFALMGTTMAPGYDLADFALGDRATLAAQYPRRAELIAALTRDS
jgi:predicted cupin superfamily sugar epimerase